ncbi:antA/AntB antirepressor family protein [Bartonella sp. B12(2025)]
MNTLIPISEQTIDQETVQTVNARELHAFLEVKSEFRNWIKNRIEEYAFSENQDFVSFGKNLPKPSGGRPSIEYHLTLDMAKELAMVERNEKGKQARQYFIECERRAKQVSAPQIDYSSPEAMLGFLTHLQGQIEQKAILFVDKIKSLCLFSNQVPQKHLKSIADRLPKQSLLRTLKALTHYTLHVYNGFVGCGYAIQYPLWGKHNDGLSTVFLSTRHSSGVLIKNL